MNTTNQKVKTSEELEYIIKYLKTGETFDYVHKDVEVTVLKILGGWWYVTCIYGNTTSTFVEGK